MDEKSIVLAQPTTNGNAEPVWIIPRSVEIYKSLYSQAWKACHAQGMSPGDSLLIAAHVLTSIGIHIPSAMQK